MLTDAIGGSFMTIGRWGGTYPLLGTVVLAASLLIAGCSQKDADRQAASASQADATVAQGPESIPPTDDGLMMQVTEGSAPPPQPIEEASPSVPSADPGFAPLTFDPPTAGEDVAASPGAPQPRIARSMDATAAPKSMSFAPSTHQNAPSSTMQSRLQRYSAPSGGSAEPRDMQSMESAYALSPEAPAETGTMRMAPMSDSASLIEAPSESSLQEPGPVDLRRMENETPDSQLGAGNPAIQTRPDGSKWVKIFYATDRSATFLAATTPSSEALGGENASTSEPPTGAVHSHSPWQQHLPVLFCIVGTVVAAGFAYTFSYRKAGTVMLLSGAVIAAIVFGTQSSRLGWFASDSQRAVEYGGGRGELRFGVCQVSLPPGHERGTMESPSYLHLEWRPDPKKHVALLETIELDREACLAKLNEDLAQSDRQEIFVFIHGYNVSFEDAARRTGQLAHDLDFPGPAMLYSWPSQGTTAGYPVDENNVAWTVPHLKDVLQTLQRQTGADAVHVVAHSMGNRALTAAVRELALEGKMTDAPLGQIVLAAPDVDAEVFRRDLLPAMQASAERVTLYASSYDRALIVSKTLHGYPRAGESGEGLVLAQGLETIDVSGIDLSLLGHSYYGDVVRVVDDLKTLIFENKAAAARPYLVAREKQGLAYWQVAMQPVAAQPGTLTPR